MAGPNSSLPLDSLYVGSTDGKIHRLSMTTGADQKQFTVGDGTSTVGDL